MLAPAFLSATTSTIWISLACFSSMLGMSRDSDEFSEDNTTEMLIGLLPKEASKQVDVGAKSNLPACGPLCNVTLALLPSAAAPGSAPGSAPCGSAGAATSASHRLSDRAETFIGAFIGRCIRG